jgi:hypothetical protein
MKSLTYLEDYKRENRRTSDDPIVRIFTNGEWVEYVNLDALSPAERLEYIETPRDEKSRGEKSG